MPDGPSGSVPPLVEMPAERVLSRRQALLSAGALASAGLSLSAARLVWRDAQAPLPAPAGGGVSDLVETAGAAAAGPPAVRGDEPLATEGTLRVPPLLAPVMRDGARTFALTLQQGQTEILEGYSTATLGINGSYLGPVLRARVGDTVAVNVVNRIGEATTLHWHGMHLPAVMDGGPHQVIEPGGTWRPRWTIRQPAATLWFHPHLMGATREQVTRGLVGLFLLDDESPAQAQLPHTYGVDDLPLVLQDQVFGADGQFLRFGRGQPETLVGGTVAPWFRTPAARVRLRLLNASSNRIYSLSFDGDRSFWQVASDGGLLPGPVALSRLQLGPAERAEIVVDVAGAVEGQAVVLRTVGGGFGGFGRDAFPLLRLESTASGAAPPLPERLAAIERLAADAANVTRDMVLGGSGGQRTINGRAMRTMDDMHELASTVYVGDTEVWNVVNTTRNTHLFHVHDVQFQVLDRNGAAPPPNEAGRKDTVMVRPGETVRIVMRFADYADPETPYMFHCHILDHEDQGMMGQFVVLPR